MLLGWEGNTCMYTQDVRVIATGTVGPLFTGPLFQHARPGDTRKRHKMSCGPFLCMHIHGDGCKFSFKSPVPSLPDKPHYSKDFEFLKLSFGKSKPACPLFSTEPVVQYL